MSPQSRKTARIIFKNINKTFQSNKKETKHQHENQSAAQR